VTFLGRLDAVVPNSLIALVRPITSRPIGARIVGGKGKLELALWERRLRADTDNSDYGPFMLHMAGEPDAAFLEGRIVADFGCGPRGSLAWASGAALRIGIDVLADRYFETFTDTVLTHDMVYLKSTERVIPLPSDFVDVMFTLNAIDHVDDFPLMCQEIVRVIKPGGVFVGSFNLEEPASATEPQRLNERLISRHLLDLLDVQTYRITGKPVRGEVYAPFFDRLLPYEPGAEGFLWVRAAKPGPSIATPSPERSFAEHIEAAPDQP
jgi:SAM-dependent methyltransferase